jgi:hypothetical protein
VHINAAVDAVVLQRANHLQSRPVANVGKARVFVSAEISLEDASIGRAVEDSAPRFQFAHAIGRLLRMQLGHAPVVDILAAAHGVGEMHLPTVPLINMGQGGRDAALRHDRMRLSQQTFANHPHGDIRRRSFNGRAQTRAAGTDDQYVVVEGLVFHSRCGARRWAVGQVCGAGKRAGHFGSQRWVDAL